MYASVKFLPWWTPLRIRFPSVLPVGYLGSLSRGPPGLGASYPYSSFANVAARIYLTPYLTVETPKPYYDSTNKRSSLHISESEALSSG